MAAPAVAAAALLAYRAYKAYRALKKAKQLADAARKAKRLGRSKQKALQNCPRRLEAARRKGVRDAWTKERDLVRRTGNGTRRWTRLEKDELLKTGKVKGYEGHHIKSVEKYPQWAGDHRNIKFVKGRAEHLKEHGGNFQNPTQGPLIKR